MSEGLVLQTATALAEQTPQPLWLSRQHTCPFHPFRLYPAPVPDAGAQDSRPP